MYRTLIVEKEETNEGWWNMKSVKREMEKKSEISCFIEELSMVVIVKPSGENLEAAHIPIKPFLSICYLVLQVLGMFFYFKS